ncbi:MAG: hypothetical protein EBU16_05420 [Actinobacteria bacterium]|nr:hypothetical protein [Actinomycetota bacterium]
MFKRSNKARAGVLAATLGLLLATTSFATTSNAATVKNGVACKKAGLKTKSAGKNYVCDNNPYVTPTKLTWTLTQCPQTYELYLDSKDQYEIFKDILASSGAEGQAQATTLLKGISDLEALMKTKVCKKGS